LDLQKGGVHVFVEGSQEFKAAADVSRAEFGAVSGQKAPIQPKLSGPDGGTTGTKGDAGPAADVDHFCL
jgi:hypothetical protein